MSTPYRWTSGRMLHFAECIHFYDDMPPREATPEELRTLPVCSHCAGQSAASSRTAGGPAPLSTFLCPS